jgi:hypothetical protein
VTADVLVREEPEMAKKRKKKKVTVESVLPQRRG